MHLSIGIAAKDRVFAKAIRRVRPALDSFCTAFDSVVLVNPIHDSLLVGISDDLDSSVVTVVPNKDGVFQVLCGFDTGVSFAPSNDATLTQMLFSRVASAILACPFSAPDKAQFATLLDQWPGVALA